MIRKLRLYKYILKIIKLDPKINFGVVIRFFNGAFNKYCF